MILCDFVVYPVFWFQLVKLFVGVLFDSRVLCRVVLSSRKQKF